MSDHRNRPNTLLVKLNKMFLKKDTIPFLSTRFSCDKNLPFFLKIFLVIAIFFKYHIPYPTVAVISLFLHS